MGKMIRRECEDVSRENAPPKGPGQVIGQPVSRDSAHHERERHDQIMSLHKRHDLEQRNRKQAIERVERLTQQCCAKREMQHAGMPDGRMNGRLGDRGIDPPEVPDIHETIARVGEEARGKIKDERPGQHAEKNEIERRRDHPVFEDACEGFVIDDAFHIGQLYILEMRYVSLHT